MSLQINKKVFGKLASSNQYFVFGKTNPNNVIINTSDELAAYCQTMELEYERFPNEKWNNIAKELNIVEPFWEKLIPKEEYTTLLISYLTKLIEQIKTKTNDKLWYYSKVQPIEKYVLSSFKTVVYSDNAEKLPYKFKRTSVGRLISENNINLFLMNQERREHTLVSRFEAGKMISLDLKAHEPRTMLAILNPDILIDCVDVYETVAKASGLDIERNIIKLCLLKILNGASIQGICEGNKLSTAQASKLKEMVYELFHYHDKISELRKSLDSKGRIFNHFGRPHKIDTNNDALLFTYFMQSTSADICLIVFSKFIKLIQSSGHSKLILPITMIYDSLVLDVRDGYEKTVEEFMNASSKVKIGNKQFDFPMTINIWNNGENK